ncbi:MAG: 2-C-methyl-D-erythritol 4-phosphate cytidylyltransferase [Deinococcales bacterium]
MIVRKPSRAALIPAAGSGSRLGKGPKAFLKLRDRTLLERVVNSFSPHVDEVIVAVSGEMKAEAEAILGNKALVILGGDNRQESVYSLLHASQADLVLIHDAARPFLAASLIKEILAVSEKSGAATVARAVVDTLIHEHGEAVDRQKIKAIQTPQAFRRSLILRAHEAAKAQGKSATDDAGLLRLLHYPVSLVEGSSWLFKITTPTDLAMAEALAPLWDEQPHQTLR